MNGDRMAAVACNISVEEVSVSLFYLPLISVRNPRINRQKCQWRLTAEILACWHYSAASVGRLQGKELHRCEISGNIPKRVQ